MAKKTAEHSITPPDRSKRAFSKLTFGAKSVVSGEEYKDPNAADWEAYHQKQADKERERLKSLEAS
jgi:hypothetical protein